MKAVAPLPIREDWTPAYLKILGEGNRDFAYGFQDPQGAPADDGHSYHSAVDWFAPGGTPVASPVDGTVCDVSASRGNTGQIFGGVVRVRDADGRVWVLRHVDPWSGTVRGMQVKAGIGLASVTDWRGGSPHLHLEIWRTLTGGYRHENMIDPHEVEWLTTSVLERPEPALPHGGTLRLSLNGEDYAGWDEVGNRLKWIARNGLEPETTAVIAWRGNKWTGPVAVSNVAKHLVAKYLNG